MKLLNATNAIIDIEKLRDYCLNPNHPEGKHKARIFKNKLAIGGEDAELLRERILGIILTAEATEQSTTAYGRRFVVDLQVTREEAGSILVSLASVRTARIIRNDEDFPRLVTCFIP